MQIAICLISLLLVIAAAATAASMFQTGASLEQFEQYLFKYIYMYEDFFWHINVSDWSQSRAFLTISVEQISNPKSLENLD